MSQSEFSSVLSKEQIAQCLSLPKFSPKFQTHVYTRFSFQEFEGRADVSDISTLSKFQHLQQVDVSKGKIQSLAALRDLHGLYDLDASYNELVEVLDFETPDGSNSETSWTGGECYIGSPLLKANLSHNQIFRVRNLSWFKRLVQLDLSNNKIQEIGDSLLNLTKLKTLTLANNNLKTCDGMPPFVQNLNLAANALTDLSPLSALIDLQSIVVDKNRLVRLEELSECPLLQHISAKSNWITSFDILNPLQSLEQLCSISLHGNPIQRQLAHYRLRVILRLQNISVVDDTAVTADEKVKARVCVGEETELRREVHTKFLPLDLFYDTLPPFKESDDREATSPMVQYKQASESMVSSIVNEAVSPSSGSS
eukprot:g6874.t1